MARKSGREKDIEAGMVEELVALRQKERELKKKLTTEKDFYTATTPATKVAEAKKAAPKKATDRSVPATDKEKAKVIKLQSEGMSYRKIEAALGWHNCNGARAHRIVKLAEASK